MASLLDIVPITETVSVTSADGNHDIECFGINVAGVAHLLVRFPALKAMLSAESDGVVSDPQSLIEAAPDAIAAVLAAGTGHLADRAHERAAEALTVDSQMELLGAILRLTLPQGIGPFVERLTAMFGAVSGPAPLPNGKASDTNLLPLLSN